MVRTFPPMALSRYFPRVKRHNRICGLGHVSKECYGEYLGEFLWRERFLSRRALGSAQWRQFAFWSLCDLLAGKYFTEMRDTLGGSEMHIPDEELRTFHKLKRDTCPGPLPVYPVHRKPDTRARSSAFTRPLRVRADHPIDLDGDSDLEMVSSSVQLHPDPPRGVKRQIPSSPSSSSQFKRPKLEVESQSFNFVDPVQTPERDATPLAHRHASPGSGGPEEKFTG